MRPPPEQAAALDNIEKTIHIAIKYANKFGSHEVMTIQEHTKVILQHGAVWFGKIGQPISAKNISVINKQSLQDRNSYLYLIKGSPRAVHRGTIIEMAKSIVPDEIHMVPEYYHRFAIMQYMSTWTKLSKIEEISTNILSKLRLSASRQTLDEVLRQNTGALFIVEE